MNVDTDTDVLFRSLPSQETLQPEALMAYLRQARPEIHHLSEPPSVSQFYELSCGTFPGCLLTEEDGPRNVTEPNLNTAAMFLEEFHAWSERHDHNRPSLGADSEESRAQNGRIRYLLPSSMSPYPVAVPIEELSSQIRRRSLLWLANLDLDQRPNEPPTVLAQEDDTSVVHDLPEMRAPPSQNQPTPFQSTQSQVR